MSWKSFWRGVGEALFWCVVVAFFVWVGLMRKGNEDAREVQRVNVVVCDSLEREFVTPEIILTLFEEAGLELVGQSIDELDLKSINDIVEGYSFVSQSRSFVDYDGTLTVELYQRRPVMRILSDQGHDLYLSRDMYSLPVQPHAHLNLPVVTGALPLPFEVGFSGDIVEALQMVEKNCEENYNFLYKLINFVELTEQNPKWQDKIVQMVAVSPKQKSDDHYFREPSWELIPRRGDYIVEIGTLDNVEAKLERWQQFIQASVVDTRGGVVNVEFDGQAVWRAPKSEKKK